MGEPESSDCDMKSYKRKYLETGELSDCEFLVGKVGDPDVQVTKAHKVFLATSSPVFKAMFYGEMAEKNAINISDISPDVFKKLLIFIYTSSLDLTSFDEACDLYYAAKKYILPGLEKECTKFMESFLNPHNVCRAYEFAKLFEESRLMNKCISIFQDQTQEVLADLSFQQANADTIKTIFEQEKINISELELFSALEKYASNDNLDAETRSVHNLIDRSMILDALKNIRLLTLTAKEFTDVSRSSKLLTVDEKLAILFNICSPHSDNSMPDGFSLSTLCRKVTPLINNRGPFSCIVWINREGEFGKGPNRSYPLSFSCDTDIYISGLNIGAQIGAQIRHIFAPNVYQENVNVYILTREGFIVAGPVCFKDSVTYDSTFSITFDPIHIKKCVNYTIIVQLNLVEGSYPVFHSFDYLPRYSNEVCFKTGNSKGVLHSIIFSK